MLPFYSSSKHLLHLSDKKSKILDWCLSTKS